MNKTINEYRKRRLQRLQQRGIQKPIRMDADEGTWKTINGTHVQVKGGEIVKGPKELKELNKENKSERKGSSGKSSSSNSKGNTSSSASKAPKTKAVPKTRQEIKRALKSGTGKTNTADTDGHDSLKKHTEVDGNLTPEREKLHEEIVLDSFVGVEKPPAGEQKYVFMGGGPAAGKSSALKNMPEYNDNSKFVQIDPDGIKGKIPEYKDMVSKGDETAAAYAHEESSALAKRISGVASENGYNVMMDETGDGSVEKMRDKIRKAKASGAKVEGIYCTIPIDEAIKRANARAEKTGRKVPREEIINIHKKVSDILPQIASEFDNVKLYDTSSRDGAVLIAEGGGGKPLKILDKEKYDNFINKTKYQANKK